MTGTHNPYREQEKREQEIREAVAELNLPDDWSDRMQRAAKVLWRRDRKVAEELLEAVDELLDAFEARGEHIRDLSAVLRAVGEDPDEIKGET